MGVGGGVDFDLVAGGEAVGGLMMIWSCGFRPLTISRVLPRSRPILILRISTFPVRVDDSDRCAFGAEEEDVGGDGERWHAVGEGEVHLGIGAGEEFAVGVGDGEFGQEGAAGLVDGAGGGGDFGGEGAAGEGVEGEFGLGAFFDEGGEGLGDLDVDAEGGDLADDEEGRGGVGLDQVADVGIAGADDAVEGGVDDFEGLEGFEVVDVGGVGDDGGTFGLEVAGGVVVVLLGDDVALEEGLLAGVGGLGEDEHGLGLGELALGLGELLVDGGGVDLGEDVAFLHVRADVEVPFFQVAVGLGEDGGLGEGLGLAGQDEIHSRRGGDGLDDVDVLLDGGGRGAEFFGIGVALGRCRRRRARRG